MPHGNSHQNFRDYHLYEITDREERETFKFGISDGPISGDGLSKRPREQVSFLNLAAGWLRFFARIILTGIPGRKRAEEIENEHFDAFEAENGRRPRGNPIRGARKK